MSANPTNASRTPRDENEGSARLNARPFPRTAAYHAPGREALQALLAFSSLHDQIRRRRTQRLLEPEVGTEQRAQPEQFMLDEVLQLVCERALAITGTDGVAIAMADGDEVLCRAAAGNIAPDVGARVNPDSGFSGACFRSGMIVRCDDVDLDPRVDPAICHRMGVRSMLAVPLSTDHGVVGLISAFCSEAYGFNDSDVRSLSLLAELILAALHPEENLPPAMNTYVPRVETPHKTENRIPVQAAPVVKTEAPSIPGWNSVPETPVLPNVQSVRAALSRVTEENQVVSPQPAHDPEAFLRYSFSQSEEPPRSKGLVAALIVLGVLALLLAGLTLWWWHTHSKAPIVALRQTQANPNTPAEASPSSVGPNTENLTSAKETPSPQVNGIRHWTSTDSTTVAIDLQAQIQYEAHRLTDPERIYFDLRDTTLAAGVPRTIEVGDALLSRIRIAQPAPGITRVVLETKNNPTFSVSLSTNPYRLMIEIRSVTAKPKTTAKVDLFAPANIDPRKTAPATPASRWLMPANSVSAGNSVARVHANHFRIVIDAGHGGWDMGTVGRKGLLEKDLVLDVVARLGKLVTNRLGAEVIYTRGDDTYISLEKRTEVANLSQADMFLSVHANYSDSPNARGVETYYTNTYSSVHARTADADTPEALNVNWTNVDIREKVQQSRRFAQSVQQSLYHALAVENPALPNRGVKEASYVVLTGTTMPAILAEVSFVSSPADEANLLNATYRQQIAEALYKGVAAYSESARRVNLASGTTPKVAGQ